VIKKLDKLIIKAFIGPFIATFPYFSFCISNAIFLALYRRSCWQRIGCINNFQADRLCCCNGCSLALPLSLLLSSIMTFGNLGESFELVAIKSSGIPLLTFYDAFADRCHFYKRRCFFIRQ
jgi:lipopolysaccharide export system permease protein